MLGAGLEQPRVDYYSLFRVMRLRVSCIWGILLRVRVMSYSGLLWLALGSFLSLFSYAESNEPDRAALGLLSSLLRVREKREMRAPGAETFD